MISLFIAEDQEVTRRGLCAVLGETEHINVVGSCANGTEALEKILALKPRVALIDMTLPGLDGATITSLIKEQLPEMRVIMYSADGSDENVQLALTAGVDAILLKGTSIRLLINAIKAVHAGATWLDPTVAQRALKFAADAYNRQHNWSAPARLPAKTSLSRRESQILSLVAAGQPNSEIAEGLGLSVETVKTHVRHIMEKMAVSSRTEAAIKAIKMGISA
jgi:DNA-binding NarL/FixJ family response regulator